MFTEGMTVTCDCEDWYSTFGQSMTVPLGTKLTIKRTYRFNTIQMLEFEEFPDNGFMASGFIPYLN
jgi:hypothetical protein